MTSEFPNFRLVCKLKLNTLLLINQLIAKGGSAVFFIEMVCQKTRQALQLNRNRRRVSTTTYAEYGFLKIRVNNHGESSPGVNSSPIEA